MHVFEYWIPQSSVPTDLRHGGVPLVITVLPFMPLIGMSVFDEVVMKLWNAVRR